MRARHGADAVEGVAHVGDPVAQRVVHRILQRAAPGGHRHHLGAQQPHAEHVRRLPFDIVRAHVDHAFQPELGADRRRRHAMLARARLGDDPGLAHAAGEDDLAQHIVDLVRAGMVQLVALEIDLRPAEMLGQPRREIERRGTTDVVLPQVVHLGPEIRVGLGMFIARFEIENQRHQRLGHEASAEDAETTLLVGAGHVAVDAVLGHGAHSCQSSARLYPMCEAVKPSRS